ncbi:MAG: SAM-dependent DNA methyltransferase [Alphaproteobacteria bacterium]|nr:SAM-dependent DNA methyltransferase [Alphaproteobacteria bacterium]
MLESVLNFSNKIPYNPLLGDVSQLKKDVFSHVYEKTVDIAHKKENGQFFTHKEIVSFILDSLPIKENSTILDPTCGAAAFLVGALQKGHSLTSTHKG